MKLALSALMVLATTPAFAASDLSSFANEGLRVTVSRLTNDSCTVTLDGKSELASVLYQTDKDASVSDKSFYLSAPRIGIAEFEGADVVLVREDPVSGEMTLDAYLVKNNVRIGHISSDAPIYSNEGLNVSGVIGGSKINVDCKIVTTNK